MNFGSEISSISYFILYIDKYLQIYRPIYIVRVYANLADMIPSILVLDLPLDPQQKLSSGRSVSLPSYPEGHVFRGGGSVNGDSWCLQCILGIIPQSSPVFHQGSKRKHI